MDRFRAWMRRISVRITVYYLLAFVLALLLITLTMSSLFHDRLTEEISLVVGQKMSQAGTLLDSAMSETRAMYFALIRDEFLQSIMKKHPDDMDLSEVLAMKQALSHILSRFAAVRSVILITLDDSIYDPIYKAEPYKSMLLDDPEYQRYRQSPYSGRFCAPSTFPLIRYQPTDSQQYTITYFGHYYEVGTYRDLGTVAINVAMPSLVGAAQELFEETFESAMIVDEAGRVILQTGKSLAIDPIAMRDSTDQELTVEGQLYAHFTHRLSGYPNWTLSGLVSYQTISAPIRSLYPAMAAVCALVITILISISASISHRITLPLRKLSAAMARLGQGEWMGVEVESSTQEIDNLLTGYNAMVDSLHLLTDRITQEQVEKRRIKVAMIQSQLDLLQSQINPHFIHNTLNTMRYLAQKEGVKELSDMIMSFNSLLRASMSQASVTHSLEESFENLQHYMRIQRKRYDVDLVFTLDAEPAALAVQIPKLLLQPLVENALFHGIAPLGRGSIRVLARVAEERLWVSVIDDGAGIEPDVLMGLLKGTRSNARSYNKVGLSNVNDRLLLFYGSASHLVVDSVPGIGTTISFSLPINGSQDSKENESF